MEKDSVINAWVDEEDEQIEINLNNKNKLKKLKKGGDNIISGAEFQERLREQFTKMNSKADIYKWAFEKETDENTTANDEESMDDIEKLLKTNKGFTNTHDIKDSNILQLNQMPDLNKDDHHHSIISSLEFSPIKEDLVLTAGLDKKMKLYSINEKDNKSSNIQTINTVDMPIFNAKFMKTGKEILISGRRKHFYLYDLESNKLERCGGITGISGHKEVSSLEKMFVGDNHFAFGTDQGYILIYDARNKTYRYDIKINGSVNSVCFDKNGLNLYAVGDQSEIYMFDLRKYRSCVNKINDSGNFNTTYMDISKDNNYLSTASNSGLVNIYSLEQIHNSQTADVEPIKVIIIDNNI